ncbi:MAG: site-specific DNA-methyltransferase [Rhodopila sp.]|jgi:site-specific DNA-methyltransferase (adenine-specific)
MKPNGAAKIPAHVSAALDRIREQIKLADAHVRLERLYYLVIGQAWLAVKGDPLLDEIGGIEALKPMLPRSVPWLNRCAVAFDGHETGDLGKAENWARHTGYQLRNTQEPYIAAELTEAYRTRLRPRKPARSPLAMTAERLFVRSEKVSFGQHGIAVLGDYLELIRQLPDGSVDAVIDDPPYGIWGEVAGGGRGKTELEWDKALDWPHLWPEIWRVLKPTGSVVIVSAEPLTAELIHLQRDHFLYKWRWLHKATNVYGPKYGRPLSVIDDIPVFSRATHHERTYNPQMRCIEEVIERLRPSQVKLLERIMPHSERLGHRVRYHEFGPIDLIDAPRSPLDRPRIMHGQKPASLMQYLVGTHTNPGETVLDFTAGGFTTGVAALTEGRKFLLFENYRQHFALGTRRLTSVMNNSVGSP